MNSYKGLTATEVATGTSDVQGIAATPGLRLMGVTGRETAGTPAAATALLRHGTTDTSPLIEMFEFAANEDDERDYSPNGIPCPNGIFVDRVAGETQFVLYTLTV